MHEIGINRDKIVAVIHRVDQLLAHFHERRGAAGREIEPAEQFLPARLGRKMDFGDGLVIGVALPGRDRGFQPCLVRPKAVGQGLEESDARPGRERRVLQKDIARERDAGGLAPPGQQLLAFLDQVFGARDAVDAAGQRAFKQSAAAVGNGLQHVAEKRGVHFA